MQAKEILRALKIYRSKLREIFWNEASVWKHWLKYLIATSVIFGQLIKNKKTILKIYWFTFEIWERFLATKEDLGRLASKSLFHHLLFDYSYSILEVEIFVNGLLIKAQRDVL